MAPMASMTPKNGTPARRGTTTSATTTTITAAVVAPLTPTLSTGGTQALYDWNGVRVGDAAGRHRTLRLAATGSNEGTWHVAVGGAAVLALGAATLFRSVRRRAVNGGVRQGR
ncbi:hypothetical protein ACIO13_08130 [Streptomyces sp. NPDC087425]|uniref:hypothetical protein n=2 Tax=unclassified Streptomyces TaxID=2593676 RepID=UPI0038009583